MNKLVFGALAASAALIPATAQAQSGPAGAGHSWGRGGGGHVVRPHPGGGTTVIRHHNRGGGFRGGFVGGGFFGGNTGGGTNPIVILPGNWGQFHYQPLHPGAALHPYWHGQQFQVRNWSRYGFAAPPRGHRWVRHFDDAYMIDGRGQVRDFRHNLDWDQYGDAWVHEGGIPRYAGDGDYRPDGRDYAAVAGAQGQAHAGWDYREYGHAAPHGPPPRPQPHPMPHPGYGAPPVAHPYPMPHPMPHSGYGAGYGYSSGYSAGYGSVMVGVVTITETTTTVNAAAAAPQYVEEIIEEEVVHRPRVRRPRLAPPRPRAVRPPPGERG